MKVLVIGSGGREHALVWKLRQSPRVAQVFCLPGNGGICRAATCAPGDPKNLEGLLAAARELQPHITVVGPARPLSLRVVYEFTHRRRRHFGPSPVAAQV